MEIIIKVEKLVVLSSKYDFTINPYLLDALSHVVIMTIEDVLWLDLGTMTHHIQTM